MPPSFPSWSRAAGVTVVALIVGLGAVPKVSGAAPGPAPGAGAGVIAGSGELSAPFRVLAGGQVIDVDVGHAAPLVVDFDGDGLRDLLVGQFGNGQLRLYRNRGSEKAPEFSTFAWFQAGGADARVPAG